MNPSPSNYSYRGACRCRQVRVVLSSNLDAKDFQPRSDGDTCQFCAKHGGIWISDPQGKLLIAANASTEKRRFASEQIEFNFCTRCGDLVYASYADPASKITYGVARRDLFVEIAAVGKPVQTTDFSGESLAAAKARRIKNWTPLRLE